MKWGLVGCGRVSGDFLEALKLLPDARVVAVAAGDRDRAADFLARHHAEAKAYGSYTEIYKDPDVEVVYIGNLNHLHKESVIGALRAGKHVVCEKPMGVNAREVREMVAVAREEKLFLMEGYWTRFFPVYKRIRESLASEEIGKVHTVLANFGYASHDENKYRSDGGGCLMATGNYLPMITSFLFWPERPESIHCAARLLPSGVDQSGTLTLYYSGGRMASLTWSGAADLPNDLVLIGDRKGPDGKCLSIKIPEEMWCPSRVELPSGTARFTHPAGQDNFYYPNSSGFSYEAQCVQECIQAGKLECPSMSLDESEFLAELLDECRRQIGMPFPQDDCE